MASFLIFLVHSEEGIWPAIGAFEESWPCVFVDFDDNEKEEISPSRVPYAVRLRCRTGTPARGVSVYRRARLSHVPTRPALCMHASELPS